MAHSQYPSYVALTPRLVDGRTLYVSHTLPRTTRRLPELLKHDVIACQVCHARPGTTLSASNVWCCDLHILEPSSPRKET